MENEYLINKISDVCKSNILRIDRLSDNAIATDVDIGMAYVYRKILSILEGDD